MGVRGMVSEGTDGVNLAQDRAQRLTLLKTVMNPRVWEFLL
jgi:hypothetical protein